MVQLIRAHVAQLWQSDLTEIEMNAAEKSCSSNSPIEERPGTLDLYFFPRRT